MYLFISVLPVHSRFHHIYHHCKVSQTIAFQQEDQRIGLHFTLHCQAIHVIHGGHVDGFLCLFAHGVPCIQHSAAGVQLLRLVNGYPVYPHAQ